MAEKKPGNKGRGKNKKPGRKKNSPGVGSGSNRKAVSRKRTLKGGGKAKAAKKSLGRSQKTRSFRPGLLLIKLCSVLAVVAVSLLIYLDSVILHQFEGKKWDLPARVYARPLELYEGQKVTMNRVLGELGRLGYRQVKASPRSLPGAYQVENNVIFVHTRGFEFWDGYEAPQYLELTIGEGRIARLTADGDSGNIARLEPQVIGGIYPAHNEDRILVELSDAPKHLVSGLLAVEDRDFYSHFGLSIRGIGRAILANMRAGHVQQGASTLTQQLVKNFYLTRERTISRKLREAVMSVLLELHFEKDEILEAYINEVYLGQAGKRAIHGYGLASRFYFGIPLSELNLSQTALLVGLVKGPSWFDPRRHPERALDRRNQVLRLMKEQGFVSSHDYHIARQKPLAVVRKPVYNDARYPAFLDLVKRKLRQDYREEDLRSEGLKIFTTLDPYVQDTFNRLSTTTLNEIQKKWGDKLARLQDAGVVTDANTGEVVALLGGRDSQYAGFNRALDAYRSVGSLIKPVVYLAALEQGHTLGTILKDEPVAWELANGKVWQPRNFERVSHGMVTLLEALSHSYNQATVSLAQDIGIDVIADTIGQLGINKEYLRVPSLSLGVSSMSPLEVATLYQTIAAGGFETPLRAIRSVLDKKGDPLKRYPMRLEQRVDAGSIYLLVTALQQVMSEGTGKSAYHSLSREIGFAGKTGTSGEHRDSWFAGFSGNYLAVVWMGYDDNEPTPLTGASGALKLWTKLMRQLPNEPLQPPLPDNIRWVWYAPEGEALSQSHCDGAIRIPMRLDNIPSGGSGCGAGGRFMNWARDVFRG